MATTTDIHAPRRRAFGLPLLTKELLEQSARKRTYVLRTVYACLLFFVGLTMFYQVLYDQFSNPLAVLGRGRELTGMLLGLQLAGIYLFMPAITCAVITSEKERKTLGLLFLTRLGPWTIVLEKYLGRCFTMLTFLMLSLPLFAFSYSLGGVNAQDIVVGSWMLCLTTLQVGAFAVMCSCLFRTTAGAFIGTYVLGFLFYFGPIYVWSIWDTYEQRLQNVQEFVNFILEPYFETAVLAHREQVLLFWVPPVMLFDVGRLNPHPAIVLARSVPTLLTIAGFLVIARMSLVQQAFVPAKNSVLHLFRKLDGLFSRLNENRFTKGVVLIKDATSLPDDEPIAWRETRKKSLGMFRYLLRVLLVLEVPVLIICWFTVMDPSWHRVPDELSLMYFLAWLLAALLVVVKATSLIAGERTHETLDVLLTTPLTTQEIVSQKLRGLWRLMFVVAVPLITIIIFETWWRGFALSHYREGDLSPSLYFVSSMLAVVIYLPLMAWLSLSIGMRLKTQARALFGALAAIVGWCLGPLVLLIPLFVIIQPSSNDGSMFLLLSGPTTIIPFTEFSELDEFGGVPWFAVIANFLFYGLMLVLIRGKCLKDASRYLGRSEPL